MKFKKGVRFTERKAELWFALGVVHALSHLLAGRSLIVTSLNDGSHSPQSKHYQDAAFDARVRDLSPEVRGEIVSKARAILNPLGFDIVSAEHPAHQDHDHFEWDPKPGEGLFEYLEG